MTRLIIGLLLILAVTSCEKDETEVINSLADDLQLVIESENIEALQRCCENCNCGQTIGWGADYSFPGDNFVRIRGNYYNLYHLIRYEIETVTVSDVSEKRMVLYFP